MTDQEDAAERRGVIKRLWTAMILCSIFMIVEVIGGVLSGSLAILSDAAHLFSDLASFAVAIGASHLATLPATARYTFGLKRAESLAALFSAISLVVVSVGLMYTAVQRLVAPPEEGVDGSLMSFISGIGVLVNVALAFVLGEHHVHLPGGDHGHDHSHNHGSHADDHGHTHAHGHGHHAENDGEEDSHDHDSHDHDSHDHDSHDHDSHDHSHHNDHDHRHSHHEDSHEQLNETTPLVLSYGGHGHEEHHNEKHRREKQRNVNLHAAYLHVMGDLAQSLAVFLGGLAIWWKPDWHSIDAILTLGFSIIVLWSTVGVIRSSVGVLLEETPIDIDWQEVYDAVSAAPNVTGVHDLHIWCISHGQVALSLHCFSSDDNAIFNINKACLKFGIKHTTIQVNRGQGCTCHPSECCTSQIKVNNEL